MKSPGLLNFSQSGWLKDASLKQLYLKLLFSYLASEVVQQSLVFNCCEIDQHIEIFYCVVLTGETKVIFFLVIVINGFILQP